MWNTDNYILALIFILFCFLAYHKEIKDWLSGRSPALELFAIVLALVFFLMPKWSAENEFKKNLSIINCINAYYAGYIFKPADGHTEFNLRYSTDFYKSNWAQLLSGLTPIQINSYIGVIVAMDSSNDLIERTQQNEGMMTATGNQKSAYSLVNSMNASIAESGKGIEGIFNEFGFNPDTCEPLGLATSTPRQ